MAEHSKVKCECPLVWRGHGEPEPDPRRVNPDCPLHGEADGEVSGSLGTCPMCGSDEVKDAAHFGKKVWVRCQACGYDRFEEGE